MMELGDPAASAALLRAIDQRIDAALVERLPRRQYGVVASVAGTTASVYLLGSATASPGFKMADRKVAVGDTVRVVVTPTGDRYIESLISQRLYGTVFPIGAPDQAVFYHENTREWYFYDSTASVWLSCVPRRHSLFPTDVNLPLTGYSILRGSGGWIWAYNGVRIEDFEFSCYVTATNGGHSGTHHWTLYFRYSNGTGTTILWSGTTLSSSAANLTNTWGIYRAAMSYDSVDAREFEVFVEPVNTPGAIYVVGSFMYRGYRTPGTS